MDVVGQELPDFKPTASWCYRFARYHAIPEILMMPEVASGQPVHLIELSKRVLDTRLTKEQQAQKYPRAKANGELTVVASVKFFISPRARDNW